MNKSKVTTLILMLVLVLGVLIFPLVAKDNVPQPEVGDNAATTAAVITDASAVTANGAETTVATKPTTTRKVTEHVTVARKTKTAQTTKTVTLVDENGYYYDLEHVVLYLEVYNHLPANYITKKQAQALGWSGGSVERYKAGAAIGGDRFGNYEKILPSGGSYTECDLDTDGGKSRGAKRLIFSSDGRYYYTKDHYEHFTEYVVNGGKVEPK